MRTWAKAATYRGGDAILIERGENAKCESAGCWLGPRKAESAVPYRTNEWAAEQTVKMSCGDTMCISDSSRASDNFCRLSAVTFRFCLISDPYFLDVSTPYAKSLALSTLPSFPQVCLMASQLRHWLFLKTYS